MEATTILVVDDEQAFTEILAQRLGKRGYDVRTAGDGAEALQHVAGDEAIEVVVLDIAMPGMDGLETLKAIKKIRPLVEVIMLTGKGTVNTAVESMKFGAFNYLAKPCEIEDLTTFIKDALQHRKNRQAKILDVRMTPFLSPQKREEMIAAIMAE